MKKKHLKIVADNKIPFLQEAPLAPYAELVLLPGAKISRNDLLDADALITRTRTQCGAELLEGTPVRFIATATIGFDHIDAEYCKQAGIVWTNAPGCNSSSVAQYIAALLAAHDWRGKTMGVIGVGNVGRKVAKTAEILGMKVLLNDPPRARTEPGFVSLEKILAESDVVTLHTPLTREGEYQTFHLADESFFAKMKSSAYFINSSRGAVADNAALKQALRNRTIAGAALDVWEMEPSIDLELAGLLDYATPHIAGYSLDGKANGTAMSIRALAEFFRLPGLSGWYPDTLPPVPEIHADYVESAVLQAYDAKNDDRRLRSNPELFEKLRNDYPLRREYPAWKVSAPEEIRPALRALGFCPTEK